MIYLDNAATTGKKPNMVIAAVNKALLEGSANPGRSGHLPAMRAAEMIYLARQKVAKMFGATGEEKVIFTPSCTASLNMVIKGVLNSGDGMVISSMEHNSVVRPAFSMQKNGIEISVAEVIFSDPEATLRSFERAIEPHTKLVVCTHASNVTGEILPIAAIGELCRKYGVLFAVDAAQTAGVLPIDIQKMKIDFLCIAPHKGLYAPMGTGILIAEKNIEHPLIEGGTGSKSAAPTVPTEVPERLESGTQNVAGVAGIAAGCDFVQRKGQTEIYQGELALVQRFYNGLSKIPGTMVYTPFPQEGAFVPLVSFNLRSISSSKVAALLAQSGIAVRAGLHCAPFAHKRLGTIETGTVRVSPSVFNTRAEMEILLEQIRRISAKRSFL